MSADVIRRHAAAYDAILLDVDNGPEGLIRKANDALYDASGLQAARRALRPGGVLAVWSSGPHPAFSKRLRGAGFDVSEVALRATAKRGGAPSCDLVCGEGLRRGNSFASLAVHAYQFCPSIRIATKWHKTSI